jgi:uncharacterized protein YidB (DUF937 family)
MAGLEDLLGSVMGGGQGGAPDLGGLLGQLTGGASTSGGAGGLDVAQLAAMAGPILGALKGGGLQNILGQLQSGGLGDAAQSWVGTGENQAVDPAQLAQAVGPEQVQALADHAGVSVDQAQQGLAALLPGLINQATPDGQVPQAGAADDLLGQLGGLLGH